MNQDSIAAASGFSSSVRMPSPSKPSEGSCGDIVGLENRRGAVRGLKVEARISSRHRPPVDCSRLGPGTTRVMRPANAALSAKRFGSLINARERIDATGRTSLAASTRNPCGGSDRPRVRLCDRRYRKTSCSPDARRSVTRMRGVSFARLDPMQRLAGPESRVSHAESRSPHSWLPLVLRIPINPRESC
jgi:hypothetical protein